MEDIRRYLLLIFLDVKEFYISGKWKKLEDIYSSLLDIIEDTETSDIAPLENRICAVSASDRLTFFLFSKNYFVYNFQPLYALIGIPFTKVAEYVFGFLYDILIISGQLGAKFMKT